jgi:hypothetical protein
MDLKKASRVLKELGFKKNYRCSKGEFLCFKYKDWKASVYVVFEDIFFDFEYRFKGDKKSKIVCNRYRFETEEQLLFLVSNSLRSPLYKSRKPKNKADVTKKTIKNN